LWALGRCVPKHAEKIERTAGANAPATPAEVGAAAGVAVGALSRFSGKIVNITDGYTADPLTSGGLTYAVPARRHRRARTRPTLRIAIDPASYEILSGKNVTLDCDRQDFMIAGDFEPGRHVYYCSDTLRGN
jgi:hypothetical protein